MKKHILLCIALLAATIGIAQAGTLTIIGIEIPVSGGNAVTLTSNGKVLAIDINTLGNIEYGGDGRIDKIDGDSVEYDSRGRVKKVGTKVIEYDDSGKLSKVGDVAIAYDSANRVSKIGTATVDYNSLGQLGKLLGTLPDGLQLCVGVSQ